MKDNRRDFLKKSAASLAAAVSIGGINSALPAISGDKKKAITKREFKKDGGMKFSFLMGPTSPRVPFALEMGVLHTVSGIERVSGFKAWDPEAITATKETWDKLGIKWCVVEGPPHLGHRQNWDSKAEMKRFQTS